MNFSARDLWQILPDIEASGGSPFPSSSSAGSHRISGLWRASTGKMKMCLGRGTSPTSVATQKQGSQDETSEFVNHGLLLWNESREKWVGHKKAITQPQLMLMLKSRKLWPSCLDADKESHDLLNKGGIMPFDKPVPLGEMVDFLVDVWEEEGMYEMV